MFRRAPVWMYTGVISNWKQGSPFGFIKDTDTGASYFLHRDDIVDGSRNRISSLPEGFRVEFDKAMFEGRTKAVAVTLRGGAPITNVGGNEAREERRDDRRDDRRRDFDEDRDDRRRGRDDREDFRRNDRDDRRDDRRGGGGGNSDAVAYDRELSRIQGSLRVIARTTLAEERAQRKLYNALVSIANARNIVVPGRDDEANKEYSIKLWAAHKENSEKMREAAQERRMERREERKVQRDVNSRDAGSDARSSNSKKAPVEDAEDMF